MKKTHSDVIKDLLESDLPTFQEIPQKGNLDRETLKNKIYDKCRVIFELYRLPNLDKQKFTEYFDNIFENLLDNAKIKVQQPIKFVRNNSYFWLTEERKKEMWNPDPSLDTSFKNRYYKVLCSSGRSDEVIQETFRCAEEILGQLGDPKSHWDSPIKGMVVGSVQSGKTTNFNAVINMALDAGYKLIIVFSGLMNDLRQQTQLRVNNDVIGYGMDPETKKSGKKGVGLICRKDEINSITSYLNDFNRSMRDSAVNPEKPNILVCKKNTHVLKNLLVWLNESLKEGEKQHNLPLLILDDEADNASLNNMGAKGSEMASIINGHLRALLKMSRRTSYVGYTATPFANVLQDHNGKPGEDWPIYLPSEKVYKREKKKRGTNFVEDANLKKIDRYQVGNLYPDDFIFLLKPPSNYIGPKNIFETVEDLNKLPIVYDVTDYERSFPRRVYNDDPNQFAPYFESKDDFENRNVYENFLDYQDYKKKTRAAKQSDYFPKDNLPNHSGLPNSLEDAVLCFILSIAVRDYRKPKLSDLPFFHRHHTMLVHISLFTSWQNRTKKMLEKYLKEVRKKITMDKQTSKSSIYPKLRQVWERYFLEINNNIQEYLPMNYSDSFLEPISFENLKNYLPDAVQDIEIKAINSKLKDVLIYPKKKTVKVIAIGGNCLSRGFTLEGLTINYFVRKTNYSDTLFQMGRWFGYRPGYLDCCKIFTTAQAIHNFNSTTLCIEDLERRFKKMQDAGKKPKDFQLRVQTHPSTLKITRASILNNAQTTRWSYQDSLEQTTAFSLSQTKIDEVYDSFQWICTEFNFSRKNSFLTTSVKIDSIIKILDKPCFFDTLTRLTLIDFLKTCKEKNKLSNWTIGIKGTGSGGYKEKEDTRLPERIQMSVRRGPKKSETGIYRKSLVDGNILYLTGRNKNITSEGKDLSLRLSENTIQKVEKEFISQKKDEITKKNPEWTLDKVNREVRKKNKPERIYREAMSEEEAVLLIYLIDSKYAFLQEDTSDQNPEGPDAEVKNMIDSKGIGTETPLIAYAIGIPPIASDIGGVYKETRLPGFTDEEAFTPEEELESMGGIEFDEE